MMSSALQDRPLNVWAEDVEDLAVFSAMLQDAVVRVGDLAFLPRTRRFAGLFTRFCWEHDTLPGLGWEAGFARVRSGLHFETVRRAQSRLLQQDRPDIVLSLLTMMAEPSETGVAITLIFAGGPEIRLEADGIEAHLRDLGPLWYTRHCPRHLTMDAD